MDLQEIVTQCCECKKVRIDREDVWVNEIAPKDKPISHGYCPSCYEKVMKELDEYD